MADTGPQTAAGKRLLQTIEALNSRSFSLAAPERVREVEAEAAKEARTAALAGLRELIDHGPHWSPATEVRNRVPFDETWGAALVAIADLRALIRDAEHELPQAAADGEGRGTRT